METIEESRFLQHFRQNMNNCSCLKWSQLSDKAMRLLSKELRGSGKVIYENIPHGVEGWTEWSPISGIV